MFHGVHFFGLFEFKSKHGPSDSVFVRLTEADVAVHTRGAGVYSNWSGVLGGFEDLADCETSACLLNLVPIDLYDNYLNDQRRSRLSKRCMQENEVCIGCICLIHISLSC